MKKFTKWLNKMDTVWIMFIVVILFVVISTQKTFTAVNACYTLIGIPVLMFFLKDTMLKKQENNYYNVDLYMKEQVKDNIVWKSRTDDDKDNIVYLLLKNIGKIDIFSIYIKVVKNDETKGWFHICEKLNIDKEYIVQVPYQREEIKEIVVSCMLQTECRTKKFNGVQSGTPENYIFSNCEYYDEEKFAIYHEEGFDVFQKLERFWI